MGFFANGNNTAANQSGFTTNTVAPSATYSFCLWFLQETVVSDLSDMWTFTGSTVAGTDNIGVTVNFGDNVSSIAVGTTLIPGTWMFVAGAFDTAHLTSYSKLIGGSLKRAVANFTETSPPTSYFIGGGAVVGGDSNPIGHFADFRLWNNVILTSQDFESESRQSTPFRAKDIWYWWPFSGGVLDVVDRIRGNILLKAATGTAGNSDGASPTLPKVYRPQAWAFLANTGVTVPTYFPEVSRDRIDPGPNPTREVSTLWPVPITPDPTTTKGVQVYPDRVIGAPATPQLYRDNVLGAPAERTIPYAAQVYPDQVLGPPPRMDSVTVVGAPERNSALWSASFPDQVLGPPPRKDAVTVVGAPERVSVPFGLEYPDKNLRPGLPTSQQAYALSLPPEPERSSWWSASYPDQVLGPPPRKDSVTVVGKPERMATLFGVSFPDQVLGPPPRKDSVTVVGSPERTATYVDQDFPDRVLGPPPRRDYATEMGKPIVNAAPVVAYGAFPDFVLGAPPRKDSVTVVGAPERTSVPAMQEYPEFVLGAPPRKDYVTEVGRPDRTSPLVATDFPAQVLGAPPRKDYVTEAGQPVAVAAAPPTGYASNPSQLLRAPPRSDFVTVVGAPERSATVAGYSYPDEVLGPVRRQDYAAQFMFPNVTIAPTYFSASYPERVRGAFLDPTRQQAALSTPSAPERTNVPPFQEYPDFVLGAPPRKDAVTVVGRPETILSAPAWVSFPDRVPGAQPVAYQLTFAGPPVLEITTPYANQVYPLQLLPTVRRSDAVTVVGKPEIQSQWVAWSYPEFLPPQPRTGYVTEVGRPDRTAPLAAAVFQAQVLGAPPRSGYVTEVGKPEQSSELVSWSYPDQVLATVRRSDYETTQGAPERGFPYSAHIYPGFVLGPLPRPDFVTVVGAPERPTKLSAQTFPDQVLGAVRRAGYFTEVSRPERTFPYVDQDYPDRVLGAPPRRDFAPLVGKPEGPSIFGLSYPEALRSPVTRSDSLTILRTIDAVVAFFGSVWPSQVLGTERRSDFTTTQRAPERSFLYVDQDYPDRVVRPGLATHLQQFATRPIAPERTQLLVSLVYQDRIDGPSYHAARSFDAAREPSPTPVAPTQAWTAYPEAIIRTTTTAPYLYFWSTLTFRTIPDLIARYVLIAKVTALDPTIDLVAALNPDTSPVQALDPTLPPGGTKGLGG